MGGNPDDERLEELRRKKMQELQEQRGGNEQDSAEQQQAEEAQQRAKQQKQALLKRYLTDEARQHLNAVRMSESDFAEQVERQTVILTQSGRIQGRIDDDKMKTPPKELQPESKSFNTRRW